ncbi:cytochrome c oxidase subunit 1 [Micromonospora viridifaciens]|uniref:Cytochrome c oxidase subunit 1 n=1 Tax=Micromonospora viridifaciens TaxID=1881 RepID=A0A1C4YTG6_MICVI|nr:cytochrome c oxidase subunit I [Micromonospora viridifaciens]SCF24043.1 cytochrome c oxidase subunit 1 [Micromonospora viridifaciens]
MPKRVVTDPPRDRGPAILAPAHFGGFPGPVRQALKGNSLWRLLRTTDHKLIGLMYLTTSFGFFLAAGIEAMLIRAELARPGLQFLSPEQYNQLFTTHGFAMLLLFATPAALGMANFLVPIQIGAPDVSFPRLNAFGYWLFFFGGLMLYGSFLTPGGSADFGWFAYPPLSSWQHSPGPGPNMVLVGLVISGLGTILTAVNLIATIVTLRAPGMTMFRMPIFTWNMLLTSVLIIFVFPLLAAALLALLSDRLLHSHVYDPTTGGPMIYQHLFWFFGHPEVYIIAVPFFGIITEIIPVFSRKPIFGYTGLVFATISITVLSMSVWAHHMFGTGQVLLPFFSVLSFLIAVPTGVKFFNWIGTLWKGQLTFETPMLFAIGFLVTFLFGGLTGVLLASPPLDFHTTDTYFVVAHFHYVLFGTVVFAFFGGIYFWFPKMTGRLLDERLGKMHFWTMFLGFHTTFLVQHWLGNEGMPRRYVDYLPGDGFTILNMVSSLGSFVLGISTLFFMYNVWKSWRYGAKVTVDDPWGFGNSLEWATTCPPPLRNFDRMPRIRSERPAFDAKYGPLVADLGRDLPQRTTKPPQHFAEELHHVPKVPESPAAEGAHGAREAVEYQPAPQSGARPVEVPEPEEIRRPSFEETGEPEGTTIQRGEREPRENERWRNPRGHEDTPEQ